MSRKTRSLKRLDCMALARRGCPGGFVRSHTHTQCALVVLHRKGLDQLHRLEQDVEPMIHGWDGTNWCANGVMHFEPMGDSTFLYIELEILMAGLTTTQNLLGLQSHLLMSLISCLAGWKLWSRHRFFWVLVVFRIHRSSGRLSVETKC